MAGGLLRLQGRTRPKPRHPEARRHYLKDCRRGCQWEMDTDTEVEDDVDSSVEGAGDVLPEDDVDSSVEGGGEVLSEDDGAEQGEGGAHARDLAGG